MGIVSQLSSAINSYGRALELFPKKGIRHYLVFPVLANLLLLVLVIWASISYGGWVVEWALGYLQLPQNTWVEFLSIVLGIVVRVVIFLLYFIFYKYLVLILISPFLAFLSERVEKETTGREFPFSWSQLWRDVLRAAAINFRNFLFEILATLALGVLAFVPLVGLLSPVAILTVQSYFFGFALMDYNAERHRMGRRETERWMRRHFWAVAGHGLVFHALFLIPVLGWAIAPVWATMAGTLSFLQLKNPDPQSSFRMSPFR